MPRVTARLADDDCRPRSRCKPHDIADASARRMKGEPIAHPPDRALAAVFTRHAAACRDGEQVGLVLAALWCDVDLALNRVIGPAGVIALYRRSLHLARLKHDWLEAGTEPEAGQAFTVPLERQLASRTGDAARSAGVELFDEFDRLLASLIGESLSQRLLHALWSPERTVSPEQKVQR